MNKPFYERKIFHIFILFSYLIFWFFEIQLGMNQILKATDENFIIYGISFYQSVAFGFSVLAKVGMGFYWILPFLIREKRKNSQLSKVVLKLVLFFLILFIVTILASPFIFPILFFIYLFSFILFPIYYAISVFAFQ